MVRKKKFFIIVVFVLLIALFFNISLEKGATGTWGKNRTISWRWDWRSILPF